MQGHKRQRDFVAGVQMDHGQGLLMRLANLYLSTAQGCNTGKPSPTARSARCGKLGPCLKPVHRQCRLSAGQVVVSANFLHAFPAMGRKARREPPSQSNGIRREPVAPMSAERVKSSGGKRCRCKCGRRFHRAAAVLNAACRFFGATQSDS